MATSVATHPAVVVALVISGAAVCAQTSEPATSYIYPAGAQRGQTVDVRVGGLCLLNDPWFEILGDGVKASVRLRTDDTVWFDGPMLTGQPSLEPDEYPRDHEATFTIAEDAPLGAHPWRVWTSQGATASRIFVVGNLPEVVEREIGGDPIPVNVSVPVTANGRIFPRTDLDIWTFDAVEGETYAIELAAKSIQSPLDARIALYAAGQMLSDDIGRQNGDPTIQFQATVSGRHEIHVHDVGYAGSQACVYRLTIRKGVHADWVYPLGGSVDARTTFEIGFDTCEPTERMMEAVVQLRAGASQTGTVHHAFTADGMTTQRVRLDISDLPERLESEPNDAPSDIEPLQLPVILNGRIGQPGDVDVWPVAVSAGQSIQLRLSAGRLGSRLLPLIDVVNVGGTVVAPTEDFPISNDSPTSDQSLLFEATEDQVCWVRIRERFPSRGGTDFGYRLQIGSASPGFSLHLKTDAITAFRGKETSLSVRVERFGGLTGPITIDVAGLPPETQLSDLVIPADRDELSVTFKPSETTPIGGHRLQIHGTYTKDGQVITGTATNSVTGVDDPIDTVLFSVAMPTPFSLRNRGPYYARVHAGTVYRHPFSLVRNGYEGPVTVRMADRQRRHLQGVQGTGEFVVPAGVTDFEFPFFLPPGMSRDRLGRCLVMTIGEVVDENGNSHQVVFTDGEQSQAPISTKAGRLSIVAQETSLLAIPDSELEVRFRLQRDAGLTEPAIVELIVPEHIRDIAAATVALAPADTRGVLRMHVGPIPGPFNMPLKLRATIIENGDPVVAEHAIAIVTRLQEE